MAESRNMTEVITAQPTSKKNYEPVATDNIPDPDTDDPNAIDESIKINQEKEKRNERNRNSPYVDMVDPDCCCYIGEEDFLFQFLCCRMISNCFVGCGHCSENCCESFCKCLCCCNEDNTGINNSDADNCGTEDCCDCGNDCGDCDCGDCDCSGCDCGDCDCGGCDCFG